jgi:hypothetical protein
VWINYVAVTAKPASKAIYGANGGFLPDETSFPGIGLAFTLLWSIQLMTCCYGLSRTIFIQCKWDTALSRYLVKHGFQIIKTPDLAEVLVPLAVESKLVEYLNDFSSPENSPGYVWRASKDGRIITMQHQ